MKSPPTRSQLEAPTGRKGTTRPKSRGRVQGKQQSKLLPHSPEMERAILGAVLLENSIWPQVSSLATADFFIDSHRKVFSAIGRLLDGGAPADPVSLREELSQSGELDTIGGEAYISSLTDGLPKLSSVEHYCRIILEKSFRRSVVRTAREIAERAQDEQTGIADLSSWVQRKLAAVVSRNGHESGAPRESGDGQGAALADKEIIPAVEQFIRKYLVLPEQVALPLALWAAATYVYQQFDVFPYINVTSPVKSCGKTKLGQAICCVAANPCFTTVRLKVEQNQLVAISE